MGLDRREFFRLSALTTAVPAVAMASSGASAAPMSTLGIDAVQLGVRAGGTVAQTDALQNAIDQTAGARVPLVLGPGEYRSGELKLPTGAQIVGVRGATKLIFEGGAGFIFARGADHVTLSGLIFDGKSKMLADDRGLVHLVSGRDVRVIDCEIVNAGGHGIVLEEVEGGVSGTTVAHAAASGVVSRNALGLFIEKNAVRHAAASGVVVMRTAKGDDGTLVLDNRIEDISGKREGGNGIDIALADNVTVRGNRIVRIANCGVHGKASSSLQVANNTISEVGDIAIHSELGFEGAVISNNTVSGAAIGVALVNFDQGGRLAAVQGNLIRNLKPNRSTGNTEQFGGGVGIIVEADAAVTGNVVENAPNTGIRIGFGQFMRDVSATGNVVRNVGFGLTAAVSAGAGPAVIAANMIADAARGSVVGMDFAEALPDDLTKPTTRFAQLIVRGNKIR